MDYMLTLSSGMAKLGFRKIDITGYKCPSSIRFSNEKYVSENADFALLRLTSRIIYLSYDDVNSK